MLQVGRGPKKPQDLLVTAASSQLSPAAKERQERETPAGKSRPPPVPRSPGAHLDEADVLGVLAEALPAHVQAVLTDEAVAVRAHAAVEIEGSGQGG